MDHNVGLSDDQDVAEYLKRDVTKRASPSAASLPYKIVRDEVFGRLVLFFFQRSVGPRA